MPPSAKVAIAAPNEAAADAGEQVVRAGGNAVDAALAAALVCMVNEVGIVSLSSGGFVSVQPPDGGPAYTVDGWLDMPGRGRGPEELGRATWDIWTDYSAGVTITIGPGSVAAHGSLAAFGAAHERSGRIPWRELVAPAIDVARGGFRLSSASRHYLGYVHDDLFGWDEQSRAAIHDRDGEITTDLIVVPSLEDSFGLVGEDGPSTMYDGELARLICDDVLGRGGILGPADLAAYAPVVRPSLVTRLGDWTLGTTPPPSVGGVSVAAMLRLLGETPRSGWDDADLARLVEVQRNVLGHRLDVLDLTDDLELDAASYLSGLPGVPGAPIESGSTAHVSASDAEGGACAVTISSGYSSGMVAAGTGIWLNNGLGEPELNPRGLHGLAPGTRLLSNMAPTVGRHGDGAALAIGSPGSDRISTAIAQVIAGYAGGLTLREAVDHPRVHVHRAGRPEEEVKVETELSMFYGGVGATVAHPDGTLEAAADPRRDGAVRLVRTS